MPTPHLPFLPRGLHTTARPSATAQWTALGRALELGRPVADRIVSDDNAPIGGAEQVLILGAGYDSRAYRFGAALNGRPVHEVDLALLSRRKAAIVAARPDLFGHTAIRRVEIDFSTQSPAERLLESGFAVGARTFVAWEGVSPYLTSSAVSATLGTLSEICGAGSVLAMDYRDGVGGSGLMAPVRSLGARAIRLIGEPVTFGLRPGLVGEFLEAHGFTVTDLVQHVELAARYSTDGRPCEDSGYVVAARL